MGRGISEDEKAMNAAMAGGGDFHDPDALTYSKKVEVVPVTEKGGSVESTSSQSPAAEQSHNATPRGKSGQSVLTGKRNRRASQHGGGRRVQAMVNRAVNNAGSSSGAGNQGVNKQVAANMPASEPSPAPNVNNEAPSGVSPQVLNQDNTAHVPGRSKPTKVKISGGIPSGRTRRFAPGPVTVQAAPGEPIRVETPTGDLSVADKLAFEGLNHEGYRAVRAEPGVPLQPISRHSTETTPPTSAEAPTPQPSPESSGGNFPDVAKPDDPRQLGAFLDELVSALEARADEEIDIPGRTAISFHKVAKKLELLKNDLTSIENRVKTGDPYELRTVKTRINNLPVPEDVGKYLARTLGVKYGGQEGVSAKVAVPNESAEVPLQPKTITGQEVGTGALPKQEEAYTIEQQVDEAQGNSPAQKEGLSLDALRKRTEQNVVAPGAADPPTEISPEVVQNMDVGQGGGVVAGTEVAFSEVGKKLNAGEQATVSEHTGPKRKTLTPEQLDQKIERTQKMVESNEGVLSTYKRSQLEYLKQIKEKQEARQEYESALGVYEQVLRESGGRLVAKFMRVGKNEYKALKAAEERYNKTIDKTAALYNERMQAFKALRVSNKDIERRVRSDSNTPEGAYASSEREQRLLDNVNACYLALIQEQNKHDVQMIEQARQVPEGSEHRIALALQSVSGWYKKLPTHYKYLLAGGIACIGSVAVTGAGVVVGAAAGVGAVVRKAVASGVVGTVMAPLAETAVQRADARIEGVAQKKRTSLKEQMKQQGVRSGGMSPSELRGQSLKINTTERTAKGVVRAGAAAGVVGGAIAVGGGANTVYEHLAGITSAAEVGADALDTTSPQAPSPEATQDSADALPGAGQEDAAPIPGDDATTDATTGAPEDSGTTVEEVGTTQPTNSETASPPAESTKVEQPATDIGEKQTAQPEEEAAQGEALVPNTDPQPAQSNFEPVTPADASRAEASGDVSTAQPQFGSDAQKPEAPKAEQPATGAAGQEPNPEAPPAPAVEHPQADTALEQSPVTVAEVAEANKEAIAGVESNEVRNELHEKATTTWEDVVSDIVNEDPFTKTERATLAENWEWLAHVDITQIEETPTPGLSVTIPEVGVELQVPPEAQELLYKATNQLMETRGVALREAIEEAEVSGKPMVMHEVVAKFQEHDVSNLPGLFEELGMKMDKQPLGASDTSSTLDEAHAQGAFPRTPDDLTADGVTSASSAGTEVPQEPNPTQPPEQSVSAAAPERPVKAVSLENAVDKPEAFTMEGEWSIGGTYEAGDSVQGDLAVLVKNQFGIHEEDVGRVTELLQERLAAEGDVYAKQFNIQGGDWNQVHAGTEYNVKIPRELVREVVMDALANKVEIPNAQLDVEIQRGDTLSKILDRFAVEQGAEGSDVAKVRNALLEELRANPETYAGHGFSGNVNQINAGDRLQLAFPADVLEKAGIQVQEAAAVPASETPSAPATPDPTAETQAEEDPQSDATEVEQDEVVESATAEAPSGDEAQVPEVNVKTTPTAHAEQQTTETAESDAKLKEESATVEDEPAKSAVVTDTSTPTLRPAVDTEQVDRIVTGANQTQFSPELAAQPEDPGYLKVELEGDGENVGGDVDGGVAPAPSEQTGLQNDVVKAEAALAEAQKATDSANAAASAEGPVDTPPAAQSEAGGSPHGKDYEPTDAILHELNKLGDETLPGKLRGDLFPPEQVSAALGEMGAADKGFDTEYERVEDASSQVFESLQQRVEESRPLFEEEVTERKLLNLNAAQRAGIVDNWDVLARLELGQLVDEEKGIQYEVALPNGSKLDIKFTENTEEVLAGMVREIASSRADGDVDSFLRQHKASTLLDLVTMRKS